MNYSLTEWMLFFYIYCFFGWCIESTYVSLRKKRLVNRGFLHGPVIPIYGFGAVTMLWATLGIRDSVLLMFFVGMAAATLLELLVGMLMEAVFKVKYWDYSDQRFQYKGYICLSSSLAWGFLTIVLNEWLHRPVERLVLGLSGVTALAVMLVISVLFVSDTVLSVKVALNIRSMLDARQRIRKELSELQRQVGLRAAALRENAEERRISREEKWEVRLAALEERIAGLEGTERFAAFSEKLVRLKKESESQREKMAYLKMRMFQRNPSATSKKFFEEFAEVREWYEKRRQERKDKKKK